MRLINAETLQLEEFLEEAFPEYTIFSHTWDEKEVTFQDFKSHVSGSPASQQHNNTTVQKDLLCLYPDS